MKRLGNRIFSFLLVLVVAFSIPAVSNAANTSVRVTLEVLQSGALVSLKSGTYYVTVYSDSACTNVISTRAISFSNANSNYTTFTDLEAGTYYVAESDSKGNLKKDSSTLTISYPYGNIAYVTANDTSVKELKIQNNYSVDPNSDTSAKTADENQPLLFSSIAVLCVLFGGSVIFMRRRHA